MSLAMPMPHIKFKTVANLFNHHGSQQSGGIWVCEKAKIVQKRMLSTLTKWAAQS